MPGMPARASMMAWLTAKRCTWVACGSSAGRVGQGVKVGDVQLVDAAAAVGVGLVGYPPAVGQGGVDQGLDLGLAEQAPGGHQADAVVGGGKVEKGGAGRRGLQARGPLGDGPGAAGEDAVHDQGGQGELVDHLRLVGAAALGSGSPK